MRHRVGDEAVDVALASKFFAAKERVHHFGGELARSGAFTPKRGGIGIDGAERRRQNAAGGSYLGHGESDQGWITVLMSELEKAQVVTGLARGGRDFICGGWY